MKMLVDPWSELVQSGCLLEAGVNRPLLASTLAMLKAEKEGRHFPPFYPAWEPAPLHQLCQIALLWQLARFEKEAGNLAHWLTQFASETPLLSLWCPDGQYNEEEGLNSFSLLFRALGDFEKASSYFRFTEDPFLSALASENIKIDAAPTENLPDFGLKFVKSPDMTAAFTLTGHGTSLGVIRTGDVEIRAMGPEALPLSRSNCFGIHQKNSVSSEWVRCFAYKDVWLEVKTHVDEECRIDLRFAGLKPEKPLAFVFYVKAASCLVGSELLRPKSLRRFKGEAKSIIFQDHLKLESSAVHKVEVIPLAGKGCFWDSDFLVSFEIHPIVQAASFRCSLKIN